MEVETLKNAIGYLLLGVISLSGCTSSTSSLPLGGKCEDALSALVSVNSIASSIEGDKVVNYLLYEVDKEAARQELELAISSLDKYGDGDLGSADNYQLIQEIKTDIASIANYLDGSDFFKLVDLGGEYRAHAASLKGICSEVP